MPERYLDFCTPDDVELPEAIGEDEHETKSKSYRILANMLRNKFGEVTDEKIKRGIAGYMCLMKLVDDCLGRILDSVESLGLLDKTLIVFTSDHGDVLGEHRIFNKSFTFYEGETRIPFMLRFPNGYKRGETISQLASSIHFVPTLFDILGVRPDVQLPGTSLMPMIERDEKLFDAVLCSAFNKLMIRTETHKLWYCTRGDGEMYDLRTDPHELKNLFHDPSHAEARAELILRMLHLRMTEDMADNELTDSEKRLYGEATSCFEPEMGGMPPELQAKGRPRYE